MGLGVAAPGASLHAGLFFAGGPVVQFGAKYGRVKVGGAECGHNQSRVQLWDFLGGGMGGLLQFSSDGM